MTNVFAEMDIKEGRDKMVKSNRNATYRPVLILAYADSAHAVQCGRYFRRLGWEVHLVASATEARRLALETNPRVIVLDTDLPDESGWLACAKMTHEDPSRRIILLTPKATAEARQNLAKVNAAALASRADDVETLAETILGECFAEAV